MAREGHENEGVPTISPSSACSLNAMTYNITFMHLISLHFNFQLQQAQ